MFIKIYICRELKSQSTYYNCLSSTNCNSISISLALNSPSLTFNILDNGIDNPCSINIRCLFFIFRSKLKEKYCGNLFSSSKSPFISSKKYSNFGLKLFSMLNVNSPGDLMTICATSLYSNPNPIKKSILGVKV